MIALSAMLGAVVGFGFWVVLMTLDGQRVVPEADRHRHLDAERGNRKTVLVRSGSAIAGALVMGFASWPVMGAVFGLGIFLFWGRLGSAKEARRQADEADAFAGWSEQVYSTIKAGSGTNTAIKAAAQHAHPLVRDSAANLAARLEHQPLHRAIGGFADDLANPAADPVCAAIMLSSQYGSTRLTEMMQLHAQRARQDARARLEVSASRAQTRTSVRVTMVVVVLTMVVLRVMAGSLFDFYDTTPGVIVLVVVGALFLCSFWRLAALVTTRPPRRYFTGHTEDLTGQAGGAS